MRILNEQEETLVLNDICARLIHGVKIAKVDIMTEEVQGAYEAISVNKDRKTVAFDTPDCVIHCYRNMEMVKPYLRPMSSMTDEEQYICRIKRGEDLAGGVGNESDYLNSIHVDYRGLIEKGLAIEVTEENNPYK